MTQVLFPGPPLCLSKRKQKTPKSRKVSLCEPLYPPSSPGETFCAPDHPSVRSPRLVPVSYFLVGTWCVISHSSTDLRGVRGSFRDSTKLGVNGATGLPLTWQRAVPTTRRVPFLLTFYVHKRRTATTPEECKKKIGFSLFLVVVKNPSSYVPCWMHGKWVDRSRVRLTLDCSIISSRKPGYSSVFPSFFLPKGPQLSRYFESGRLFPALRLSSGD